MTKRKLKNEIKKMKHEIEQRNNEIIRLKYNLYLIGDMTDKEYMIFLNKKR